MSLSVVIHKKLNLHDVGKWYIVFTVKMIISNNFRQNDIIDLALPAT